MSVNRSEALAIREDTVSAATKAALPVSVSGGLVFGIHISELVQWATLLFLALQIGLLIPKYWAFLKKRRDKRPWAP